MSKYSIQYLGPEGSFSHDAADRAAVVLPALLKEKYSENCTADDFEKTPLTGGAELETAIRTSSDAFVVVPISNSSKGDVYDYLPFCSYEIVTDFRIPVEFCLCSHSRVEDIRALTTKSIAYKQVAQELAGKLPDSVDCTTLIRDDISTSAAARRAADDPTLGAICSRRAANLYGLPIRIEGLQPQKTTFGVFRNMEPSFKPPRAVATIYHHLMRGAHVYSGRHVDAGRDAFALALQRQEKLVVKWGVDPLRPSLHLGHLSNLLKLRDFLELGHKAVIVIGSFTGVIGDPSGNLTRRPPVDDTKLAANGKAICLQIERVLRPYQYEIVWNHKYASDFDLRHFLQWMYDTDVRHLLKRPDFMNRFDFDHGLSVAEFIYPLFQALDTSHIGPNVEIGGADQLWNCLLMKDVLKRDGFEIPLVLLVDEVRGTNGAAKMSSYEKNAIHLDDPPNDIAQMLGKLPEDLLHHYFISLTRRDSNELHDMASALNKRQLDVPAWRKRLIDDVLDCLGAVRQ